MTKNPQSQQIKTAALMQTNTRLFDVHTVSYLTGANLNDVAAVERTLRNGGAS